ncbi:hypothetical protein IV203_014857 [Nitzschia inconspicua]|uniref:Uncharacterized protein n=1 Tax=Nitzschia inconspicua TaxID=303405 RepID=A0A9K3PSI6_9STRA|nr:hypothetical protein IV203_014857 [Nitzschia inconspicua]
MTIPLEATVMVLKSILSGCSHVGPSSCSSNLSWYQVVNGPVPLRSWALNLMHQWMNGKLQKINSLRRVNHQAMTKGDYLDNDCSPEMMAFI